MRQVLLLTVLASVALSGCGRTLPELARPAGPGAAPAARTSQAPLNLPAWNLGPLEAGPVLAQLSQAWSRVRSLSGRYEVQGKRGQEKLSTTFAFAYQKPGRFRYEIEQTSAALKKGTLTFDTRSGDVTSRPSGLAGLIPLRGELSEDTSEAVVGHRLDQGNYERVVALALAPGARVKLASAVGAPVVLSVDRPGLPATDELRLGIHAATGLIGSIEQVSGGQVVMRSTLSDLRVNPTLEPKALAL